MAFPEFNWDVALHGWGPRFHNWLEVTIDGTPREISALKDLLSDQPRRQNAGLGALKADFATNHDADRLWVTLGGLDSTIEAQAVARYLHDAASEVLSAVGVIQHADDEMREDLLDGIRDRFSYVN